MRHLVIGIGDLAHLDDGTIGLITGNEMIDENKLISKNMGILINDGIIEKVQPQEELIEEYMPSIKKNLPKNLEILEINNLRITNAGGNAVIPGLIDSHTHLIWSGDRSNEVSLRMKGMSYREISEMGGGIKYTVTETRKSNEDFLINLGERRLKEALRNGTTAIEAKSGYGLDTESELRLTSIMNDLSIKKNNPSIDITWMGAHDIPPKIGSKEISKSEYI